MTTEIWLRNPNNYIRELVEVGHRLVTWDRGLLLKRRIDPYKHGQLYFGENVNFRALCIGNQGAVEIDQDHDWDNPVAVYPVYEYGDKMEMLEEMMSANIGDDPVICEDTNLLPDERPVLGQEHRVVIANLPKANLGTSRKFYIELKELQEEYPDAILHLHGSFSFRMIFGMGYAAADYEPRHHAAHGICMLPNGKMVKTEQGYQQFQQWFHVVGMKVPEMKEPRKRCIYNIKSAIWASKHWDENVKFKSKATRTSPLVDPSRRQAPEVGKVIYRGTPGPGDMINCDSCSLAKNCKYAREGAVCSVPGSEGSTLARYFQSRDSSTIIDALGAVIGTQVRRVEQAIEDEQSMGELNPQVSKDLNAIFTNGVKIAKLVDPTLAQPKLAINVGAGAVVAGASPNMIMSKVMQEFEAKGIRREDVTPAMVQGMLSKMAENSKPQQIEGTVVKNE